MFYNSRIYHLPHLDLTNVTVMNGAFGWIQCTELDITPPVAAITNMRDTFNGAKLTTFPTLNTTGCTNWDFTFAYTGITSIPNYDYSSGTSFDRTFRDTPIVTIPNNLLPTSGVTTYKWCFLNCTNLVNVPVFDASSTVYDGFEGVFKNCPSLSDNSLNNIMQTCISATGIYSSTKNLNSLGLTSEQATRCQSLSNWSAFTAAGWTTGY